MSCLRPQWPALAVDELSEHQPVAWLVWWFHVLYVFESCILFGSSWGIWDQIWDQGRSTFLELLNLRSRKIDFSIHHDIASGFNPSCFFLAIPWWIETTGSEADHFARPAGWHRALADRAAWSPRCGSLAVDHPGLGQKAQLFRGKIHLLNGTSDERWLRIKLFVAFVASAMC